MIGWSEQAPQHAGKGLALARTEGGEELVRGVVESLHRPPLLRPAFGGQLDEVRAAVPWIALSAHDAGSLQVVDELDHGRAVDVEHGSDVVLGERAFVRQEVEHPAHANVEPHHRQAGIGPLLAGASGDHQQRAGAREDRLWTRHRGDYPLWGLRAIAKPAWFISS